MSEPRTALMTVVREGGPPTLEEAAALLGLEMSGLNPGFGVIPVDPRKNLYCVEVFTESLPPDLEARRPYRGPFSNPSIDPL